MTMEDLQVVQVMRLDFDDLWIRKLENSRKRHSWRGLQPVLLIIDRMRRRIDHVEGIREACIGACVPF